MTTSTISAEGEGAEPAAKQTGTRVLSRREALLLAIALWILVNAGLNARSLIVNAPGPDHMTPGELGELALLRALLGCFGVVLCMAMHEFQHLLPGRSLRERAPWLILAALASGVAYSAVSYVGFYYVVAGWVREKPMYMVVASTSLELIWVFAAWTGFYLAASHATQLRDQQRRLAESQALASRAQYLMLRYQLNPHFLFNTLNSLSALILEGRRADAEAMVLKLAAFLRYTLENEGLQPVTLDTELEAQRLYLCIEQVRFGERLATVVEVEPAAGEALVPSLILQPFVENAIKHGLGRQVGPLRLEITARRQGDRLLLGVRDDGPGSPGDGRSGVGLENARRRLNSLYGEAAGLTAANAPGGGFAVSLWLPYERR